MPANGAPKSSGSSPVYGPAFPRHETCLIPARCPEQSGSTQPLRGRACEGETSQLVVARAVWSRSRVHGPRAPSRAGDSRRPEGSPAARKFDLLARLALVTGAFRRRALGGRRLSPRPADGGPPPRASGDVPGRGADRPGARHQAPGDPRPAPRPGARRPAARARQQLALDLETLDEDERRIGAFERILRLDTGAKSVELGCSPRSRCSRSPWTRPSRCSSRAASIRRGPSRRGPGLEEVSQATGPGSRHVRRRAGADAPRPRGGCRGPRRLGGAAVGWLGFRVIHLGRAYRRLSAEEQGLRASEERFRALVQHAADVILVLEADGTVRHVSPAVQAVLAYEPDRLVGTRGWGARPRGGCAERAGLPRRAARAAGRVAVRSSSAGSTVTARGAGWR